jgi:hypothetical protein
LLIFDVLYFQHFEKRIAEKIRVFTIIKPEAHLVNVRLKVFCAYTFLARINHYGNSEWPAPPWFLSG